MLFDDDEVVISFAFAAEAGVEAFALAAGGSAIGVWTAFSVGAIGCFLAIAGFIQDAD